VKALHRYLFWTLHIKMLQVRKFATSEDKVCMEMGEVSLKNVQTTLHEIIT
jgi:hypothetical protein